MLVKKSWPDLISNDAEMALWNGGLLFVFSYLLGVGQKFIKDTRPETEKGPNEC